MSADTDTRQGPGKASDAAPDPAKSAESFGTSDPPTGQPSTADAPADSGKPSGPAPEHDGAGQSEAPEERREQPYLDRINEEERDWLRRQENLRELGGETLPGAGRDAIGRDSNRVSGGGGVYYIRGSAWFGSSGTDSRGMHVRYLLPAEAQLLKKCLVTPPSQADLMGMIKRRSLLFLRGTESTGRTTAALHALLTWTQQPNGLSRDDEAPQVGEIVAGLSFPHAAPELQDGHGYVLEPPSKGRAWDLGVLVDIMKEAVNIQGCRLIIIVPWGASRLPAQYVDHRPPSAPEIFARWLEREAATAGVDAHQLDDLRKEIDEELRHERCLQQAAQMATRLIASVKAGKKCDEIRTELPRQQRDDIRRRLDEDKPVLGRCFTTSAAVLNGLQETVVSNAALDLVEHIREVDSIKPEEKLPAWEHLGTWLEYAAASVDPPQECGSGRIVRINPRLEKLTLQVLWEDHPTIRDPFATWLKGLAEKANEAGAQMKAAHAAGFLATLSFPIVKEKFIDPWTRSQNLTHHRLLAMLAESAVECDSDVMPNVLDLLRKLVKGTRHEQLAAAQIYGSAVGHKVFEGALQELRNLTLYRDIEICKTVAGSIGNLFYSKTAENIITALAIWADREASIGEQYTSA
ncbi:MAG TPA: hypothetical protein VHX12_08005, partial [Acidisoma sp.]|nr:hypothetical protein [Acidisoma sp.]